MRRGQEWKLPFGHAQELICRGGNEEEGHGNYCIGRTGDKGVGLVPEFAASLGKAPRNRERTAIDPNVRLA